MRRSDCTTRCVVRPTHHTVVGAGRRNSRATVKKVAVLLPLALTQLLLKFVLLLAFPGVQVVTLQLVHAWQVQGPVSVRFHSLTTSIGRNSRCRLSRGLPFLLHMSTKEEEGKTWRTTPSEEERPIYPKARRTQSDGASYTFEDSRPGAIIETEDQLQVKAQILKEMMDGTRKYDQQVLHEIYGETMDDDDDDEEDVQERNDGGGGGEDSFGGGVLLEDATTLGTWTIADIRSRFEYEWDPHGTVVDPNLRSLNQPGVRYVEETPKDPTDPTVELGYDPMFGPSSPIDRRTIRGVQESYMIDASTRDETMLQPQFPPQDPELEFNDQVVQFRKSLDIIETYVDPFLPSDLEVPRHVAKWHGYPEQLFLEPKPFENNRFTNEEDRTDFDSMTPYRARQKAVELARAKNAEWLPPSVSRQWHTDQRAPYEACNTNVGTLRADPMESFDPDLLEQIRPALKVFGSCAELLSAKDGVYRFAYHGLMKHKHGMGAWMESLLTDCGVEPSGVVMETGFRRRDPAYDGGDHWYGPIM